MGETFGEWDNPNLYFAAQASFGQFQNTGAPIQQIEQEVEVAVQRVMQASMPNVIEAMSSQCGQEIRAMIPALVEAMRLQIAQEIRALTPELVQAVRSQCAQEFRGLVSLIEDLKKMVHSSSSRSSPDQAESSASRSLRLHFVEKLPDQLATFNTIQDGGTTLTVELRDASGSRVEVGPASSVKVKILALDGDFDFEDRDDWAEEEFNRYVAPPRKDKAPLLKGNCEISLSKGVASVGNISFTDNSSRSTKNGYFRLGAQVIRGLPPGVAVREAVSKRFVVKERRGQSSQKPGKPSLEDDVGRLRKIAEKGAIWQRLADEGIHKVQDFLQLYHTDEKKLQDIADIRGKNWRETVEHAKSCLLNDEGYSYYDDELGVHLVLNCVFDFVSVTLKDQTSRHYENLVDHQKRLVNRLRHKAYEKRSELRKTCIPINQRLVREPCHTGELETPPNNVIPPHQPTQLREQVYESYLEELDLEAFLNDLSDPVNSAQAVTHGANERGTRCSRDRWNSVRAVVVMFRIAIKLSDKQCLRPPKRHKLD